MYDFDLAVNRRNTNSLKWNVNDNELPMWVADMDFKTAPEIIEAIRRKVDFGVFGYTDINEQWYNAYIEWWSKRHAFDMDRDWLIFCTGVIPAISSIVRKLTTPAEKVLLMTPVYNIFYNSVLNNGRQVLECQLKYADKRYSIDYHDLEQKLSDPQTTLMILCNPHNPIGKIWSKSELYQIGELCAKHNVTVVADEIHCDLTTPGCSYTPFASVSENCLLNSITCIAPTKAFNLAGIQTAAVSIANPVLRHKVWRALNTDEVAEPNVFAVDAAIAAFSKGEKWLDSLREYIENNHCFAEEFIKRNIPQISVTEANATYLLWLDCSRLKMSASKIADVLRTDCRLYLSSGEQFGGNGKSFLRMNIACPRTTLVDGLNRLKDGICICAK